MAEVCSHELLRETPVDNPPVAPATVDKVPVVGVDDGALSALHPTPPGACPSKGGPRS
jgi:hypothetical protein